MSPENTSINSVVEAFTALGETCKQFANAMGVLLRAATEYAVTMYQQATALNEAPPRVRHLAKHGKKYRTRKKNINRALRDYQRRHRKRDRP